MISYILKHHSSVSTGGPCLLYYNRGIKRFQLIPLEKFFERAGSTTNQPGEYQIEHFWIGPSDTGEEDIGVMIPRAPQLNDDDKNVDFTHREYSMISENRYTLSDMSGSDSTLALTSRSVHTYDHDKKRFYMLNDGNDIVSVKDHFEENYTDKLFPGPSGSPLFVLNNDKKNNKVIHQSYVPYNNKSEAAVRYPYGRNFTLQGAVFLNLGITFTVPGNSNRHPGRFIGIEKVRSNTDNKYDYRLLGQWFVTSTIFKYNRGILTNYISAVKTNTFGDLKFNEDALN